MAIIECPECRHEVSNVAETCPNCGFSVKKHLEEEERKAKRERMAIVRAERAEKFKRKFKWFILIAVILVAVVVYISVNQYILSQRVTFNSEQEMKEYLKGYWIYENKYSDSYAILCITDRMLEDYHSSLNRGQADIIKYYPKRGYIQTKYNQYILLKEGGILKSNHEEYKHSTNKHNFTPFVSLVELSNVSMNYADGLLDNVSVSITNNGNKSYSFITAICEFKDSNGNIVDSFSDTSIIDDENQTLDPSETRDLKFHYRKHLPKGAVTTSVTLAGYLESIN